MKNPSDDHQFIDTGARLIRVDRIVYVSKHHRFPEGVSIASLDDDDDQPIGVVVPAATRDVVYSAICIAIQRRGGNVLCLGGPLDIPAAERVEIINDNVRQWLGIDGSITLGTAQPDAAPNEGE